MNSKTKKNVDYHLNCLRHKLDKVLHEYHKFTLPADLEINWGDVRDLGNNLISVIHEHFQI